jgi:hypothetical protein
MSARRSCERASASASKAHGSIDSFTRNYSRHITIKLSVESKPLEIIHRGGEGFEIQF